MAAAARSGARVLYAGSHGIGRFGDLARAALAAEGVELAHEPSSEVDTGVVVVLVDATGERTFATGTGAEGRLSAGLLDRVTPQ
jgi:ribokinase